ncbi:anti-sigma factor antagonist [Nocardia asteroides]|uniref:anti-sigma factor antagonist n=1 Tax=Nocardia asteroides TaxID=1824 RepID=UPI0037CA0169
MKPRHHRRELVGPLAGEPAEVRQRLTADLDLHPDAAILHVEGEADAYTLARWRAILDDAIAAATPTGLLVVDLSAIQFIGCRPILDLADRAQQAPARGVQIVVFNPFPGVVDRVITIAGLSAWLPIYTTLAQALATRRSPAPAPARPVVPVPGAR